ncbi:MAG: histidine phosphatase family protein [Mesorhizobium amorphae]|nr:MAG: histidine phosphatase family protein [Mesorhizobium amorphae]
MLDGLREAVAKLPLTFIVRHGETAWNHEGRLQGQSDTDINARGRAQATANGEHLGRLIGQAETFSFVSSPMRRTRETMERLRTAMGLDPHAYRTDERLRELSFGDWQGFSYDELEAREPGITAERQADKWRFVPPGEGAESYAGLLERVAPAILELRQPTVCVTHGGVIRTLFVMSGTLTPDEASTTGIPQDRLLRLEGGRLEWV